MSSWTSGYVTDLGYTFGFYRELTPRLLWLCGLLRGQETPNPDTPLTYCELGCGQGFTINLLASVNPHIQFYGTDFNPAHIAGAQQLANDAGTQNLKLYDQAFADFALEPSLPEQFDMIVLHGIYSWITPEVRGQIVEFLRRKLRPGGVVYCSYNALPGWSAAAPLRHLMYLHGKATGGPTAGRLQPALDFINTLQEKNALYFGSNPSLKARVERFDKMPRAYLAHEYLNDAWTLLYHSDVVAEFSEAKLGFIGSAHILDHIDAINLTNDQRDILTKLSDPTLRETVRDFMVNQQFRRDLFGRGALPMRVDQVNAAWQNMQIALTLPRGSIDKKVTGSRGEAQLQADVYDPMLDALAEGPKTLAELAAHPKTASLGLARIQQAMTIMIGAGYAHPLAPEALQAKARKTAKAFNTAVMKRALTSADLVNLAVPAIGGALAVDRFCQLFLLAEQERAEPVRFAWDALLRIGQRIIKEGKALETEEDNLAELKSRFEAFQPQRELLRSLGVV